MKIWSSEHIFNHPWETVAQAAWRKYPNPMNPAVVGIDVLDRKLIGGILHTHRLISSNWGIPGWAQMLVGGDSVCYASEHSQVDPQKRKMVLRTRNLTFCRHIAVDEQLEYSPHPTDPSKTLLTQDAIVTVRGVPLTSYMEGLLTNSICSNAGKGRQGMEWAISKVNSEVQELATTAVRSTDEFLTSTRKSLDDISLAARKSIDDLQNLAASNSNLPKL